MKGKYVRVGPVGVLDARYRATIALADVTVGIGCGRTTHGMHLDAPSGEVVLLPAAMR